MVRKSVRFIIVFLMLLGIFVILVPASEAIIRIMPLGNSITRGFSGSSDQTGYRRELDLLLTGAGYTVDFVGSLNGGIPNDFDKDHEGHSGVSSSFIAANVYDYLVDNPADIVMLHIGTNDFYEIGFDQAQSLADVEEILDEIDSYEDDNATAIWVILARIINRNCSTNFPVPCLESVETTTFNNNVAAMAQDRIDLDGDKILIVDMENGARIDYPLQSDNPPGDMADNLHPFDSGYKKMANVWFFALMEILNPAGSDEGLSYTPVTPCRIIDTRISQGGAGPIIGGTQQNFSATDLCSVPSGQTKAVMLNITAVNATGAGNLRAFAYPAPKPFAATLSFGNVPELTQGISNAAFIPICDTDISACPWDLSVWVSNTTDVVVDVMGYFSPYQPQDQ